MERRVERLAAVRLDAALRVAVERRVVVFLRDEDFVFRRDAVDFDLDFAREEEVPVDFARRGRAAPSSSSWPGGRRHPSCEAAELSGTATRVCGS